MNDTTPTAETAKPSRRPSKRVVLLAGAIAAPAVAGALFLGGAANASSDAPQGRQDQQAPQTFTVTTKSDGSDATVTFPDGTTQKLPDGNFSGWVSIGADGKVHQGTGDPTDGKAQSFSATSKDDGSAPVVTYPDGTTKELPKGSGWVSVDKDGKVTQGTGTPDWAQGQPSETSAS